MEKLKKIQEAAQILKDMNYPTNLLDEKASLCFIVLTGKEIQLNWKDSYSRKIGRSPILQFINAFYGKSNDYRSLVSVQKRLYPLLDLGIVINTVFQMQPIKERPMILQISKEALDVAKSFGTDEYQMHLGKFLKLQPILIQEFKSVLEEYKRNKKY